MKTFALPLAVSAMGALIAIVSAVLLVLPASASDASRGGHAIAVRTTKAPLLLKQKRGVVRVHQTVRAVLTQGPDGLAYRKP